MPETKQSAGGKTAASSVRTALLPTKRRLNLPGNRALKPLEPRFSHLKGLLLGNIAACISCKEASKKAHASFSPAPPAKAHKHGSLPRVCF